MESLEAPISVLVVDDDSILLRRVKASLEAFGVICFVAENEEQMQAALARHHVDAILLDVVLPGADGFAIMQQIRETSDIAILMLTSRDQVDDRLQGLNGGADDYISKPFDMREVVARIEAVLRRKNGMTETQGTDPQITYGQWRLDPAAQSICNEVGQEIKLSDRETELACIFLGHPDRTFSRQWLHRVINHREWTPDDRSVDILVGRLRKKFSSAPELRSALVTERNVGYRFLSTSDSSDAFQDEAKNRE